MKKLHDDTNVIADIENTEPERTEPIKVPVVDPTPKRRSIWRKVAMLLLICLLLAGLVATFLWMNRSSDKIRIRGLQSDVTSLNQRLVAAEQERAALENRIAGMQAVAAVGKGNDEEQVAAATKLYTATFFDTMNEPSIEVSKRDGSQAVATVRDGATKYNVYLKKAAETWQPVWAGKGSPAENTRKQYQLTIE